MQVSCRDSSPNLSQSFKPIQKLPAMFLMHLDQSQGIPTGITHFFVILQITKHKYNAHTTLRSCAELWCFLYQQWLSLLPEPVTREGFLQGELLTCKYIQSSQSSLSSSSSFWHSDKETELPLVRSSRIAVYVDHRTGTLLASDSDLMTLLHRVQTTFTHTLYPGFWCWGSGTSVKL